MILTIGHSNRALPDFLALLGAHRITRLADVRRLPSSRRHPHFNKERLTASLAAEAIEYLHLPELGGHREPRPDSPHDGISDPRLRGYADHMETPEFARGVAALLEAARGANLTVMCAEADPAHCHRSLLADALVARGLEVAHILSAEEPLAHRPASGARFERERVFYERRDPRLPGL